MEQEPKVKKPMNCTKTQFNEPVKNYARRDFPLLMQNMTVREALDNIRQQGSGEQIIYFYAADESGRLTGVIPTRRLLTANPEQLLCDIMEKSVIAIPENASVLQACEFFAHHRFLALPVVDSRGLICGVIDVGQFTEEVFNIAERRQADTMFEAIGFRAAQIRGASALKAFRFRFPWLLATITSGTVCAIMAGAFEITLAKSLVIAMFLALVLGLAESVSMQSMTVTIQSLKITRPTIRWYLSALTREMRMSVLLGGACGVIVACIVWLWRGDLMAAICIGFSLLIAVMTACFFGITVPWLMHACKLDPKISSGPITLALTDIGTLLFYLGMAAMVL